MVRRPNDVRFTAKADINCRLQSVRFVPIADFDAHARHTRDDVGIVLHMRNQKFVFAHATTEKIMIALAGDFFEG